MRIIAISNQKGGCGKTTSAINLSSSLAHLGYKTLLIDLDPQAHATFGLGFRDELPKGTMYNVMTEQQEKKHSFIENVILPVNANMDLAPSHILLSTIEQEFTNKDESVSKLHDCLESLSFPYDYVVIDCPPSLGFLTFNALRAAEAVIVPMDLGSFSLMGIGKLLSMIELLRVKMKHAPQVYAVATMVDMRSNFSKQMSEEIHRSFGDGILRASIRQSVSARESQARGVTLLTHNPKSNATVDYLLMAQEVTAKLPLQTKEDPMLEASRTQLPEDRFKEFMLKASEAKEVHVVGDFNGWKVSENSLLWQKERGLWQKRLFLEPGRYRYKFIIDGQWVTDPGNHSMEPNPYGGIDSVIEIH